MCVFEFQFECAIHRSPCYSDPRAQKLKKTDDTQNQPRRFFSDGRDEYGAAVVASADDDDHMFMLVSDRLLTVYYTLYSINSLQLCYILSIDAFNIAKCVWSLRCVILLLCSFNSFILTMCAESHRMICITATTLITANSH